MADIKEHIQRLRQAIEMEACRKMQTPKDFDFLSELLLERQGERVSASTLKRIWGYVNSDSMPRHSTLDVLAQFVGSKDWNDFTNLVPNPPSQKEPVDETGKSKARTLGARLIVLIVVILACIFLLPRFFRSSDASSAYILHAGQTFASAEEYLSLFGIQASSQPWSQPLPHHTGIILWGPEYQNPNWHNEGNADSLMPTITEYWQPADTVGISPSYIATRNADNYLRATSFGELRITFMKDLVDSTYTFLGVYRLDHVASDSSRLVWLRVAEECDLANLSYLEQLRH